ncbi:hypothetical protein CLPU_4c02230 [Gottschalkia purinilytica]|uniref:DUF4330 domain-containing protein n=1 Tax=Gottschalkia purinilytica TaxID=1503 RepID=A0A0L0WCI4_GOTPU|nr:DUF4330 domain-containing protein [Gottschalkia purinilytica]KNF09177.1 hypothetical protein CLPU_4c02230 [Gottschalkia purinilytica]
MPIIDKKGKLFGKVNILDLFIVLLIVVLGVGALYKVKGVKQNTSLGTKELNVRLYVKEREKFSLDKIKVGDVVKEYDTGIVFGKIKNIEVKPAIKEVKTGKGEIKKAEIPERYDLYIDIDANAVVNENSIVSGNKELRVGNRLLLKTKLYVLDSTVFVIKGQDI